MQVRENRSIMAITRTTLRLFVKRFLLVGVGLFVVSRLCLWYISSDGTVTHTVLSDSATSSPIQSACLYSPLTPVEARTSSIRKQNDIKKNSTFLLKSTSTTTNPRSTREWKKLMAAVKRVPVLPIKLHSHDKFVEEYFRHPIDSYVHHFSPFLYNPVHACSAAESSSQASPFLVVLVLSSYREQAVSEREAIRITYGSVTRGRDWPKGKPLVAPAKLLFLLGTPPTLKDRQLVQTESAQYDDVLVADFVDSYRNLTLKVLHGLRWVLHNCPQAKFFLKADDDVFVNLPLLTTFLLKYGLNNSIYGHGYFGSKVIREGRWAVPRSVYPVPRYPVYMSGTAYAMSTDAAQKIVEASHRLPLVVIEDAFITGILAQITGVRRVTCTGFTHFVEGQPSVCDFVNDHRLVGNKMYAVEKMGMWAMLKNDYLLQNCVD